MSAIDDGVIVPVEVRPGEFIRIARVPHDLTEAEAEKLCRVIRAYAVAEPRPLSSASTGEG